MNVNNAKKRVIGRPFQKGNPGKQKGTVSKFTSLKADWLAVHERLGGVNGLFEYAKLHPGWFYTNETRLFPQEVAHSGDLKHTVIFQMPRPGKADG